MNRSDFILAIIIVVCTLTMLITRTKAPKAIPTIDKESLVLPIGEPDNEIFCTTRPKRKGE